VAVAQEQMKIGEVRGERVRARGIRLNGLLSQRGIRGPRGMIIASGFPLVVTRLRLAH
jgi:hypothetical protein